MCWKICWRPTKRVISKTEEREERLKYGLSLSWFPTSDNLKLRDLKNRPHIPGLRSLPGDALYGE